MARDVTAKKYRIREVRVRLAEGRPLYSEQAMQTPQDAVEVMKRELKSMVEFYKTKDRVSVMDQLGDMKKTAGEKTPVVKPRKKPAEIAK